jgi:hypothetical protein
MKELHIIESETPGLTRTKITVTRERSVKGRSGDVIFTVPDFAEMAKIKKIKKYNGKRILRIYRSSWETNTYFIRYFM